MIQYKLAYSDHLDPSKSVAFRLVLRIEIDLRFTTGMINVDVRRRVIFHVNHNAKPAGPQDGRQERKPKALGCFRKIHACHGERSARRARSRTTNGTRQLRTRRPYAALDLFEGFRTLKGLSLAICFASGL